MSALATLSSAGLGTVVAVVVVVVVVVVDFG